MDAITPLIDVGKDSPTFQVLLGLSKSRLAGSLAIEPTRADWRALIHLAAEQSMLSLIGTKILARMPDVPDHARARASLKGFLLQNAQRNLALTAETLRLLSVLEEKNIEAFAFKGCVLASVAYGNLAVRRNGDIDILVRKREVMAAYEALKRSGYCSYNLRTPAEQIGLLAFDCEWELLNRQRQMAVDLHWGLSGRNSGFPLSLEPLWQRQQKMALCGQTIRTFSPADTIFVLCVHAAKHHWQRLEWIYTLAAMLRRFPDLPWAETLTENTREARNFLTLGLLLADELYETGLPEAVRARIRADHEMTTLARYALDWLLAVHSKPPSDHTLRKFNAALRPGLRGKAHYWICAAMTPTAKDYVVDVPASLHWIYYVIRVVRLLFGGLAGWCGFPSPAKDERVSPVS